MLHLLTDEQISPAVAEQAGKHCRGIRIVALQSWENGQLLGAPDELVLEAARRQQFTFVTYDLRTIPSRLRLWAERGDDHGGVVLVDEKTLPQHDVGGLVAALCALWKAEAHADWTNRVIFLRRAE